MPAARPRRRCRPRTACFTSRHGSAVINGKTASADEALYGEEPVAFASTGAWSEVWRWELAAPNAAPCLVQGNGVLSQLRMARVIASLAMGEGTRWLFAPPTQARLLHASLSQHDRGH